ncbi:methyltransferase domain-containing protein [Burkholderia gladioli]|uniref:methyltransferase domain-containing protein n=1 Tax=Burkholderia gladioli TaxID=28095 RepID=UPI001640F1B7|nr:methyltransferase domain-containing protein [Burkholderia gladioli]
MKAAERAAEVYDSLDGQVGPILFGGHMHWGYWDQASAGASFAAASERLAQMLIARSPIRAGQRFVDLGCGFGRSGMLLAREKGCLVDGITISKVQQIGATQRAEADGLAERVRFVHGSALELPFADGTYDGGWFFESIFHMGHEAALAEAGRVMKPGATLLLTDLPTLPHTTEQFMEYSRDRFQCHYVPQDAWPKLLKDAGFELVEIQDITENVMPWLVPKLKEAFEAHKQEIRTIAPQADETFIGRWVHLFRYMAENLGYIIVVARKL